MILRKNCVTLLESNKNCMKLFSEYIKSLGALVVCVAFMSMVGLLAAFIGPNHGVEIKILIGMTVGAAILGPRLPHVVRRLYDANYKVLALIFRR